MKKENFQRLYGIPEKVFKLMVNILEDADIKKKKLGGRPSKLTIEQKLQMTLQYWRQYRTYFETVGFSWIKPKGSTNKPVNINSFESNWS